MLKIAIIDQIKVGERIQSIRVSLGLTGEEFGKLIDRDSPASQSLVSRWERGVNLPNKVRLKNIAVTGGITVEELLYGSKMEYIDNVILEYTKKEDVVFDKKALYETSDYVLYKYENPYGKNNIIIDIYNDRLENPFYESHAFENSTFSLSAGAEKVYNFTKVKKSIVEIQSLDSDNKKDDINDKVLIELIRCLEEIESIDFSDLEIYKMYSNNISSLEDPLISSMFVGHKDIKSFLNKFPIRHGLIFINDKQSLINYLIGRLMDLKQEKVLTEILYSVDNNHAYSMLLDIKSQIKLIQIQIEKIELEHYDS